MPEKAIEAGPSVGCVESMIDEWQKSEWQQAEKESGGEPDYGTHARAKFLCRDLRLWVRRPEVSHETGFSERGRTL